MFFLFFLLFLIIPFLARFALMSITLMNYESDLFVFGHLHQSVCTTKENLTRLVVLAFVEHTVEYVHQSLDITMALGIPHCENQKRAAPFC